MISRRPPRDLSAPRPQRRRAWMLSHVESAETMRAALSAAGAESRELDDVPDPGALGDLDEVTLKLDLARMRRGQQKHPFDAGHGSVQAGGVLEITRHNLDLGSGERSRLGRCVDQRPHGSAARTQPSDELAPDTSGGTGDKNGRHASSPADANWADCSTAGRPSQGGTSGRGARPDHPLRLIKTLADTALAELSDLLDQICVVGWPPPSPHWWTNSWAQSSAAQQQPSTLPPGPPHTRAARALRNAASTHLARAGGTCCGLRQSLDA